MQTMTIIKTKAFPSAFESFLLWEIDNYRNICKYYIYKWENMFDFWMLNK